MNKIKALVGAFAALVGFATQAAEPISYLDWDAEAKTLVEKSCADYEVISSETEMIRTGWYVVEGTVTCEQIEVYGEAHLILKDGAQLTARYTQDRIHDRAGILVAKGNSLAIYGQGKGTGN